MATKTTPADSGARAAKIDEMPNGARVPADYREPRYLLNDGTICTAPRDTHHCGTCDHEYFGKPYGEIDGQDACEACYRANRLRLAGVERFEAFDPDNLRGTVWAAYNAATEVSDWREGRGAEVASVWGGRAREKASAFTEALQVAGMN